MTAKSELLARFTGMGDSKPVFLPDLTLWYRWHRDRDTLPDKWRGQPLARIARDLGVPAWTVATPWEVSTPGVSVLVTEKDGERTLRIETTAGALFARWTLGPDGDWWQTEYLIKSRDDFMPALEWIRAREYVVDGKEVQSLATSIGDDGILAVRIPRRPYADLLGDLLGWSDGLMLLGEPEIQEMLELLETKLQAATREIAQLPGDVIFSLDNLDGQFISPRVFERNFAASYRTTMDALAVFGKPPVVHAGGPVSRLLKPLAESGVSGVEGVCGPPQGDATLAQARAAAGPNLTLWGGIPQDALTDAWTGDQFEQAVQLALEDARDDPRIILGVADMVPAVAELERLEALSGLTRR